MRTAFGRRHGALLALVGTTLAIGLGYAAGSPDPGLQRYALGVVALAALVVALLHPVVGLALGAALPLGAQALADTTLPYVGIALLFAVVARTWPSAPRGSRNAALLIAGFGVLTCLFGVLLAPASLSRLSVLVAVAYATVLGVAAALSRIGPTALAAVLAGLGVWMSVAALRTPQLSVDRTVPVLGENANGVGMFAGLGVVAALVLLRRRSALGVVPALGAAAFCLMGVYVSGSRGAVVVCVVGLAGLVLAPWLRRGGVAGLVQAAAVLLMVSAVAYELVAWFGDVTGRVARGADDNLTARSESLSYAVDVGSQHPLFGVGLTRLGEFSRVDLASGVGLRAHNLYAGTFAELGVVGLVPLLLLCVLAIVRARRHSAAALALVAAVLSVGISLEWWGAGGTGPLALVVLGWAAGRAPSTGGDDRADQLDQRDRAGRAGRAGRADTAAREPARSRPDGVAAVGQETVNTG